MVLKVINIVSKVIKFEWKYSKIKEQMCGAKIGRIKVM